MAKYTAMLREFFDQYQDGTKKSRDLIEEGRTNLFDFDYPIFDEAYKNVFETHFIRKFYMREIGFETFGLFKFHLETWLLINMPYFNKLFESELLEYDPLTNSKMDITSTRRNDKTENEQVNSTGNRTSEMDTTRNEKIDTTKTGTKTGNITGSSDSNTNQSNTSTSSTTNSEDKTANEDSNTTQDNFQRQLESDTPDNRLQLTTNDGQGVIEYASKIVEQNENNVQTQNNSSNESSSGKSDVSTNSNDEISSTQNTETTSTETDNVTDNTTNDETSNMNKVENDTRNDTTTSTINDVEDFIQHRAGKIGVQTYAKLISEYRDSLLRIENKIFDEMSELFMLVY